MPRIDLDHLYRETHHWVDSVAWWSNLGFTVTEQWGEEPHRAGSLRKDDAVVVLAEVPGDATPGQATFLATDDVDAVSRRTGVPVVDTHWGTRMVSVTDPDGRTYNFEPGGTT